MERQAIIEPPIQGVYRRSGGAMTRTSLLGGASVVSWMCGGNHSRNVTIFIHSIFYCRTIKDGSILGVLNVY